MISCLHIPAISLGWLAPAVCIWLFTLFVKGGQADFTPSHSNKVIRGNWGGCNHIPRTNGRFAGGGVISAFVL